MEISTNMVAEWRAAQNRSHSNVQESGNKAVKGQLKWQPPPSGWYKMNVDAALHEGIAGFKVGMVLRNDRGEFIKGMQKGFSEEVTILEAEAIGVQESLVWIADLGVQQVIVESDSLSVVNAILKNTMYVSEVGTMFDFCRTFLRHRSDLKVQHVRRQANRVAHNIARLPCTVDVNCFTSPPSCVMESIVYDYSFH